MKVLTITDKEFEDVLSRAVNKVLSKINGNNVMTIKEAAVYTGMSVNTLYKLTSAHEIPYSKPTGGRIYFSKKELTNWMLSNKVENKQQQVTKYLINKEFKF